MKLGYNTNGLAHHRWDQALELIAEAGYRSVAITVDHQWVNPFANSFVYDMRRLRKKLEQLQLDSVIETGARFLLNPRRKHEPTLVSATQVERDARIDFLCRCVDIAGELGSQAVSFWSGILSEKLPRDDAMLKLAAGCRKVLLHAERRNVPLAFEPEPGMFIATMDDFSDLLRECDGPGFGLTIDVGHVHCVETKSIPEVLRDWGDRIRNIHIEDMLRGIHEHLPFGEGTIDFPPVLAALKEINYQGGVHVELSRHSHEAPTQLRKAYEFLTSIPAS
ncbi:MAG: sugar phosphate isomerase/epimerase family protein [Planctomycetaceae bacterium]